jgi:hypothetical protein
MLQLKFLLHFLCLVSFALSDFEDCSIASEFTIESDSISLKLNGEELRFKVQDAVVTLEDSEDAKDAGFFCEAKGESEYDALEPCRNYVVHAEKQMRLFPDSMKCYRSKETSVNSFILVMNRANRTDNVYKFLEKNNVYEQHIRFLAAVVDWVRSTAGYIEPLMDDNQRLRKDKEPQKDTEIDRVNENHWFNTLVFEQTPDGAMFVRYRHINTQVQNPEDKSRVSAVVEEVFRFVKNFFYFGESCYSIIAQTADTFSGQNLWLVLKNHPGFPRNFGFIIDLLKNGYLGINNGKNGERFALNAEHKHKYLIQAVVFGYCTREIQYSQPQLTGLLMLLKSLFAVDVFFDSLDDSEEFESVFQWKNDNIAVRPSNPKLDAPDFAETTTGEFFIQRGIVDNPPFMSQAERKQANEDRLKALRERKAEKSKGNYRAEV